MYQVLIYAESLTQGVMFFKSDSLEDCIQVALNLHRGCNCEHRVQVYDIESSQTRLSLYSEDFR